MTFLLLIFVINVFKLFFLILFTLLLLFHIKVLNIKYWVILINIINFGLPYLSSCALNSSPRHAPSSDPFKMTKISGNINAVLLRKTRFQSSSPNNRKNLPPLLVSSRKIEKIRSNKLLDDKKINKLSIKEIRKVFDKIYLSPTHSEKNHDFTFGKII